MKAGSKVIVRANESGVWFGVLLDYAADWSWVRLGDAMRLWRWQTKSGVSCSGLAANGIDPARSTVAPVIDEAIVCNPCEVLSVAETAAATYALG